MSIKQKESPIIVSRNDPSAPKIPIGNVCYFARFYLKFLRDLGNLPYSVYKHIFPTGFFFGAAGKLLYRLTYIHRSICFLCSAFFLQIIVKKH
ncbi:MAG: hypothetical protein RIR11_916 [Bacteroidota bacterium]